MYSILASASNFMSADVKTNIIISIFIHNWADTSFSWNFMSWKKKIVQTFCNFGLVQKLQASRLPKVQAKPLIFVEPWKGQCWCVEEHLKYQFDIWTLCFLIFSGKCRNWAVTADSCHDTAGCSCSCSFSHWGLWTMSCWEWWGVFPARSCAWPTNWWNRWHPLLIWAGRLHCFLTWNLLYDINVNCFEPFKVGLPGRINHKPTHTVITSWLIIPHGHWKDTCRILGIW